MSCNIHPRVAINCLVYNHEPYLRDCLEGFVMQQTDFPFVAIVHDDASTDHSADIIREYAAKYPDIIQSIYETENQYSKKDGSLRKIMNAAIETTGAPYIAMCEGDDYWTDPHKLQKQVDFLEKNKDYVLVHTDKYVEFGTDGVRYTCSHNYEGEDVISLLKANTIATCTTLYRAEAYQKVSASLDSICRENHLPMGDYPLWLLLTECGKIAFLSDCTAVYRILPESASHSKNVKKAAAFDAGTIRCKIVFYQHYIANNNCSKSFNFDFNEMIFHMRKRMLLDYGWTAKGQIIPLLKMLPHWPRICMQSIRRKLSK